MSQLTNEQIEAINQFVIETSREMIEAMQDKRCKASELPSNIIGTMLATTKLIATLFAASQDLHPRIVEMITLQVNANVSKHFAEFIGRKFGVGVGLFGVPPKEEEAKPSKGFSINPQHDPSNN